MADEGAPRDPGGQQPEFVKGQDAAARAGGVKPADQSERATAQTAPDPKSLDGAHRVVADNLKDAAERDTAHPARYRSDAEPEDGAAPDDTGSAAANIIQNAAERGAGSE